MIRNYIVIALRNLVRNKGYSFINISGLATGMTVAILIGLWVYDELSFNKCHQNYDKIVQIMKGGLYQGKEYVGQRHLPFPLIAELQTNYSNNFKHIVPARREDNILSVGEKNISRTGTFMGEGAPEMLTLKMIDGTWSGLHDPHSIMLSASTAKALFGETDPMNKVIQINHKMEVKVTGVYEDLPYNTEFHNVKFFAPWDLYVEYNGWMKNQDWHNHFLYVYAEIAPNISVDKVNENIREAELKVIRNMPGMEKEVTFNPIVLLHPMADWHLYSNFREEGLDYGPIQSVRIIAIIGSFVLLLACINFMNLSTARSEKRAKEVGIRKSIGSVRSQLISQFFSESFLVVLIAFVVTIVLISLTLPWFNELSGKEMQAPWINSWFWLSSTGFIVITGLLAGSYPALYLSSFNPVKVLKGTFRAGRSASVPRKILVVVQFTVSVALIIGTIIVYNQVIFAKNRPVGYTREGLLMVQRISDEFYSKTDVLRNELKKTGVVTEMAASGGQVTEVWSGNGGFSWQGKSPDDESSFATLSVSPQFGKTVGWQFIDGRDFSEEFVSDSSGFVLNEAAAKYMNLENTVGEIVHWSNTSYGVNKDFRILGVIKDMVMDSPFEPVKPTVFFIQGWQGWFNIKINPEVSAREAMPKIEAVFKKVIPSAPFNYKFVDQEYASKFAAEERIGKLAFVFSVLAIIISCLGLFGLASFMSEQRTKEIGIRKVVGASVFNLWRLLSKDFVLLTIISCLIAAPIAYYSLQGWLENYQYRTEISWWIFLMVSAGAIAITLITVSFQAIKAATMNPVKSLKSE
jgi:putative ABC transport system permease protein